MDDDHLTTNGELPLKAAKALYDAVVTGEAFSLGETQALFHKELKPYQEKLASFKKDLFSNSSKNVLASSEPDTSRAYQHLHNKIDVLTKLLGIDNTITLDHSSRSEMEFGTMNYFKVNIKNDSKIEGFKDYIEKSQYNKNVEGILEFLKNSFGVDYKFIDEKDVDSKYIKDGVKSYYHDGVAYIIRGNETDQIAAEEMLHPFVLTLAMQNRSLFESLTANIHENFPKLVEDILSTYPSEPGYRFSKFTSLQNLEIVTQGLSRAFARKFENSKSAPQLESILDKFTAWVSDLMKQIMDFVGLNQDHTINLSKLSNSKTPVSDLVNLLYTSNLNSL